LYSVLKIQEPIGPVSILVSPPSATVMVCTVSNRLSLIEFPLTAPTRRGASGLRY
jgi:hypothetical protein